MKTKIYNDWNEMVKDDDTMAEYLKNNKDKDFYMWQIDPRHYNLTTVYLFESTYYTVDELNTILHRRNILNEI